MLYPKQTPPYYQTGKTGVYIAILSQTGTNNPTATIIHNTIHQNLTWIRDSAGTYKTPILTGAFPIGKTTTQITTNHPAAPNAIQTAADQAIIYSSWPLDDSVLDNTTVIIIVNN